MGFLMSRTRGEQWAHDEHKAEHMLFFNNVAAEADDALQKHVEQQWTYITKLHHPDLSQLTDATVGSFWLEEELSQRHLFASEQFPHVAEGWALSTPEPLELNVNFIIFNQLKE